MPMRSALRIRSSHALSGAGTGSAGCATAGAETFAAGALLPCAAAAFIVVALAQLVDVQLAPGIGALLPPLESTDA